MEGNQYQAGVQFNPQFPSWGQTGIAGFESFVRESWAIEGLRLLPSEAQKLAWYHESFCSKPFVTWDALEAVALKFTGGAGRLRYLNGMNVRVGSHYPPPGGEGVVAKLKDICEGAEDKEPYHLHREFENLHPFLDGNGRTGRLLWLWAMFRRGWHPDQRSFLHEFYYQSLQNYRGS